MNVRAWSVSLLLFLSTVTAVGQTVNRYLNTPLPKEWEESGEVFQQTLPVDDHWWKSFQDTRLDSLIALAVDRNYSVAIYCQSNQRVQSGVLKRLPPDWTL